MDVRICIVSGDKSMSDKNINIEKDGHVLVIRFTNNEMRNSLSPAMRYGLANAIHQGAGDHTVRVPFITGSGQSFCAGRDFESFGQPMAFRTEAFQEAFKAVKSKADANFPAASDREYWHKHLAEKD